MRRVTRLEVVSSAEDEPVISFEDRYAGSSTHRLQCGNCGYDVATGVDPYLYPVMFEGARYIACSQCASLNALPIDL